MFDNNSAQINNFSNINPYSRVDTANGMPINNLRLVEPVNNGNKSREYIQRQNFKNINARNLSPSLGDTTEKFLKSKNLLTPVFNHNEARTKYDMISRIEHQIRSIKKQVEVLA